MHSHPFVVPVSWDPAALPCKFQGLLDRSSSSHVPHLTEWAHGAVCLSQVAFQCITYYVRTTECWISVLGTPVGLLPMLRFIKINMTFHIPFSLLFWQNWFITQVRRVVINLSTLKLQQSGEITMIKVQGSKHLSDVQKGKQVFLSGAQAVAAREKQGRFLQIVNSRMTRSCLLGRAHLFSQHIEYELMESRDFNEQDSECGIERKREMRIFKQRRNN